jgi:hypothetical protein
MILNVEFERRFGFALFRINKASLIQNDIKYDLYDSKLNA